MKFLFLLSLFYAASFAEAQSTVKSPFKDEKVKIKPVVISDTVPVAKDTMAGELEEIIVQSTRTSGTIANVPTRVETIELEEIDEKNNMRPANVAMLLHESTGIQVQQTSATSGNASIRIQGLDGKYTQLLKDGFANFGSFSSGLSVLEIPPLDLSQVEIIKGPASPLFGGGAIAGVVNFISKTPRLKPEYSFIINQSNIGQFNAGGFASGRKEKIGYTMLALYNKQKAYDVDDDHFTEVPESDEFTLHPKLFFYLNKFKLTLGNSYTSGRRQGGDTYVIKGTPDNEHRYFELNQTSRNISTLDANYKIRDRQSLTYKQSVSLFDRSISIPAYQFSGVDLVSFSDVSYLANGEKHSLVLGGSYVYNRFRERARSGDNRSSTTINGGVYGQHTWDANEKIKLETGLRLEGVRYRNALYSTSETFVLPRVSLLVRFNSKWSSRIGGGRGYKAPTLFTEASETIQYQNIDQLSQVGAEKSIGTTADVNFRSHITDELELSVNHMFFFTRINDPLVLQPNGINNYRFSNVSGAVNTAGFETNLRFVYAENFKLFLGYTFTDAKADYLSIRFLPLVPKHKLNSALIYEKEGSLKLGLEGYFTGRQYLSNGTRTPSYEEFGFMAEKIFSKFSLYVNFENFTDTRQSRYKNVVNGPHLNPNFDEIWTHTEGFVVNGGVKVKL